MIRRPPRSTLFPTRRSSDLKVLGEVKAGVERLRGETGVAPMLAVVLVGEHRRHRSEEHTSELQSHSDLVCRLLLEKKKKKKRKNKKKEEHREDIRKQ